MAGAEHVDVKLDSGSEDFDEFLGGDGRLVRRREHQLESRSLQGSPRLHCDLFAGELRPNTTDRSVVSKTQDLTVQRLSGVVGHVEADGSAAKNKQISTCVGGNEFVFRNCWCCRSCGSARNWWSRNRRLESLGLQRDLATQNGRFRIANLHDRSLLFGNHRLRCRAKTGNWQDSRAHGD